jgi:hypothetical protein
MLRITGVAQDNPVWVTKTYGTAAYALGVVAGRTPGGELTGKVYAIGGWITSPSGGNSEYDPNNNTWVAKTDMLAAAGAAGVAAGSDGQIYVMGGFPGSCCYALVQAYDPVANNWAFRAGMPTPRYLLAAAAANGKIYAIGGASSNYGVGLKTVEEYDPWNNTWTTKAPMHTGREYFAAVTATNGKIYAIGGIGCTTPECNAGQEYLNTMEEYDPDTDTWTPTSCMPAARGFTVAAEAPDGKIYVIGGANNTYYTSGLLTSVVRYDTVTKTWESGTTPTPIGRHQGGAAWANGRIYLIGGQVSAVEEYNPAADTWAVTPSDPTCGTTPDTTPPSLTLPANITAEATSPSGAVITYSASASDVIDGSAPVICTPASGSTFGLGTTTVSCSASDQSGNTATGTFTVTVRDTTPPTASLSVSPGMLWPPNHQKVAVTRTLVASDLAGPVVISGPTVTSNEPIEGLGDGDTSPDWIITGTNLQLRAERSGRGNGRTYTITYVVGDPSGNTRTVSATVVVPKSQGK